MTKAMTSSGILRKNPEVLEMLILLEILEECIVFHDKRIYIRALYRRRKCAVQVKYSTSISISVLYKKGNWA